MRASYPRRQGAPGWALLATLGAHLLLAWSWRIAHPPAPAPGGERVFHLVPVAPRPAARPPRAPVLRPVAPVPRRAASTAPAPAPVPDEAVAPVTDPFAADGPHVPAQPSLEALLGNARRDAGRIDRALRQGKPGVTEDAASPMARFRGALEEAHKESSLAVTQETYTAPDGQVIYRFRRGGKYFCRSGGSVGPQIGGAVGGGEVLFDVRGGGGRAGLVRCPGQAEWQRD